MDMIFFCVCFITQCEGMCSFVCCVLRVNHPVANGYDVSLCLKHSEGICSFVCCVLNHLASKKVFIFVNVR